VFVAADAAEEVGLCVVVVVVEFEVAFVVVGDGKSGRSSRWEVERVRAGEGEGVCEGVDVDE